MDTLRLVVGILGLAMFVIGVLVRMLDGVVARSLQRPPMGCLGTILALGLIFGGLGLMAVGGFLIDGSSGTAASDAGPHSDAARSVSDAGSMRR